MRNEGCFWKYCYWKSHATIEALDRIFHVLDNADYLIENNSKLSQTFRKHIRNIENVDFNDNEEELVFPFNKTTTQNIK